MQKVDDVAYLIVNFGGPRDLNEVEEFLVTLLTDQEVIQTPFPPFLHRLLFTRVAKKRTKTITGDYAKIGGKSPIFEDTEAVAAQLRERLNGPVLTFHRYLPKTHAEFLQNMRAIAHHEKIRIFPLFPQFSYATTGSIALWFSKHLPRDLLNKMDWIKSYPAHTAYLRAFAEIIQEELENKKWKEEETILLFLRTVFPKITFLKGMFMKESAG